MWKPCLPCARVSVENPRTVNPKPLSPHGAFPLEKSHSSDHMPRLDCPSVSAETLNPSSLLDTRRMKSKPKESEPFTRHGLQRLFEFKQVVSATLVAVSVFFKLITLKTELWTLSNRFFRNIPVYPEFFWLQQLVFVLLACQQARLSLPIPSRPDE